MKDRDILHQTLTSLSLGANDIGDEGAQNLADAFKNNSVRYMITSEFVQESSVSFSIRHSQA